MWYHFQNQLNPLIHHKHLSNSFEVRSYLEHFLIFACLSASTYWHIFKNKKIQQQRFMHSSWVRTKLCQKLLICKGMQFIEYFATMLWCFANLKLQIPPKNKACYFPRMCNLGRGCRAPLHEECPQHHEHKGDLGVAPKTCGAIGERAQVILVWMRASVVENICHPWRLEITRVRPWELSSLWLPNSRMLKNSPIGGVS